MLWANPDGRTILWDVNVQGAHRIAGNYAPVTDPDGGGGYTARSLSTGPNETSQVLWTAPGGRLCLGSVTPAGALSPAFYGPFSDDGTARTIWQPVAVSTSGGSGTHVLWSNPNGRTILWDVHDDGSYTVRGDYAGFSDDGTAGTVWKASALASGPDGRSHVLWHNPDGRTLLWDLDANDQPTPHVYPAFSDDGTRRTIWRARAVSVGPDGVVHLLWTNPNGRTILWNVASDGSFTLAGNYGPYQDDASGRTPYVAVSLATSADGRSHFAWDNPDGNTYLWSVSNGDGSHLDTFYPPFLDDGTMNTVWKAVAISAGVPPPGP